MYQNILLPIDLNHEASWKKALPAATGVLDAGGSLHLLCVVPDFGASIVASQFPPDFETKILQDAKAKLDEFASAHKIAADTHVGHGHVPEAITSAAESTGADLIVMSSHPPDELRTLFIGSNAEKVVRHSNVSVLVVR